jgi:hypothetical protein
MTSPAPCPHCGELEKQVAGLKADLACATQFTLKNGALEVQVELRSKGLWCVTDGVNCITRGGEWMWESLPSNRDEDFLDNTRFSLEEAWSIARSYLHNTPQPESRRPKP